MATEQPRFDVVVAWPELSDSGRLGARHVCRPRCCFDERAAVPLAHVDACLWAIGAARDSAVGAVRRHLGTSIDARADYCFDPAASTKAASTRCALVANGRCAATHGSTRAFTSARVSRAWCRGWLCLERRPPARCDGPPTLPQVRGRSSLGCVGLRLPAARRGSDVRGLGCDGLRFRWVRAKAGFGTSAREP
jgi:hypothetical protein